MTSEEVYKVIKKLIGPIAPIADASVDNKRSENLDIFIDIIKKMYTDIDDIAWYERDSPYGSVKSIVTKCNDALGWIHKYQEDK